MTSSESLQVRYAWLDQVPDRVSRATISHVHGNLVPRGKAILRLRNALLSGTVPETNSLDWPEPVLKETLLDALRAANVAPYCNADTEITDEVVFFVLQVTSEAHCAYDHALVAFHTLAKKNRAESWTKTGACSNWCQGQSGDEVLPGEPDWEAAKRDANQVICELIRARTHGHWFERMELLAQLAPVLAALASAVNLPPGSGRGMLRALPRDDLLALRSTLGQLPAVETLIRTLGRLNESKDPSGATSLERIGKAVQRVTQIDRVVHSEDGPEIRGIERSADVSRMLPSEAMLLARPALRLLWRARWAERALLTYHAPGVYTKRIQEKQTFEDGEDRRHPRAERGAVLVVLDTSGSMMGWAEDVGKAIVVQLVATAFMEQRPCYVYNFSGPGEVVEMELSFGGDGLAALLRFISMSFHGGTEIDEALRRVCERVRLDHWRQADVVMISDGGFMPGNHTLNVLAETRKHSSVRFHSIKVGIGEGFEPLRCDSSHDAQSLFQAPADESDLM